MTPGETRIARHNAEVLRKFVKDLQNVDFVATQLEAALDALEASRRECEEMRAEVEALRVRVFEDDHFFPDGTCRACLMDPCACKPEPAADCEDCVELGHETGRPNPRCRKCQEATS